MNEWNFKEFIELEPDPKLEFEVRNYYFFHHLPVSEIKKRTGKTQKEIYEIVHKYGTPNRKDSNRRHLLDDMINSDLNSKFISDTTGYSYPYVKRLKKRKK